MGLASRFVVKNLVRAWAVRPDLAWPLASVDRFAGMVPHRHTAHVERFRLGYCAAERVQAADEDGLSGLRWLLRRGYDPEQIVIAGDSAGGYLAFMTALASAQLDLMKPAGIAAVSPFTDANPTAKLQHRNARRCAMFPSEALMAFTRYLLRARAASPMDADLSLLPPVAIHASTDELLLPDAESMAQRLDAAGVRCDLHLREGQVHDFPLAADVLPEGRRAIRYVGEFVKEVTEPTEPGTAAA